MKKTLFALALVALSFASCDYYYAGYGKGQATHRKCGQRNMNSRIFGDVQTPSDTAKIYFVTP